MLRTISFVLNQIKVKTSLHPATTVLDYIRKNQHLTGTKEGCREGDCGACTVLIGTLSGNEIVYQNINSCLMPIAQAEGKHIVTIEGLNSAELSIIQQSFVDEGGTQCGFCTPGFIVSLTAYLLSNVKCIFDDAIDSIGGNVCRCTGHTTIKRAVKKVLEKVSKEFPIEGSKLNLLIHLGFIPKYFEDIPKLLGEIKVKTVSREYEQKSDFLIAGGTDLFIQKEADLLKSHVNFVLSDNDGDMIWIEGNQVCVAAKATISNFGDSEMIQNYFPEMKNFIRLFGSLLIRNRATIGGNIINASPIGDITCILLALNSTLHLQNGNTTRQVPLREFYKGYKTLDKTAEEILTKVTFDIPKPNSFINFEKVSKRIHLDIASVNTAILLKIENKIITQANISAGGVAPIPLYLCEMRKSLLGKKVSAESIYKAIEVGLSEISPITDVRGSAEYKKLLLRQLLLANFYKYSPQLIEAEVVL
jgi:xanthine dehydrogenase small subunit